MDLLSSRPFWPLRDGLPATFPPLERNATCDVAIIGGGISGALLALQLTEARRHVVLLDRREVAHGSTAGNTGLVLHDLDVPLHRLAAQLGRERAERAYRRCRDSGLRLQRLVRRHRIECELVRRQSLYLAATRQDVPRLRREFSAREAAGLEVEWWSRRRLAAASSLPHPAGILSPHAAEVDAYRLTYGLLLAAQRAGARVHDRTAVTRWTNRDGGVELRTARGFRVRARDVVIASGYEAEGFLPARVAALHSTFALVSEPVPGGRFPGWPAERCLIWDTADPYLYLRTTRDGRAIIGGYDEPFSNPRARDARLQAKTAALARRFRQFFPEIPLEVATAWAGTFGVTTDGLPFIGRRADLPNAWFALGFGGNGIIFSVIAAEIIGAALTGRGDPDAELFGFDR